MVLNSWICPKPFQPVSEKRNWYCCGILMVLNSYWVDEASTCIFFWGYPHKSILSSSQKKSWITVSSLLQHEKQLMGEMLSWVFSWVEGTNGEVSAGSRFWKIRTHAHFHMTGARAYRKFCMSKSQQTLEFENSDFGWHQELAPGVVKWATLAVLNMSTFPWVLN